MSDFAVLAELPLGVYRARTPGEALDPLPSPVRLHAALLAAASSGTRARATAEGLEPAPQDLQALHWVEENPPDGVRLPRRREQRSDTVAFRREGTLLKEGGSPGPRDKVVSRPLVGLVAVDGLFAWTWAEPPPVEVREALERLAPDVSHLGTAETPVRLRVGVATPTHRRKADARLFDGGGGLPLDVAGGGRTDALLDAYRASRSAPSAARDRWAASSDQPQSARFVPTSRRTARYVERDAQVDERAPWDRVLLRALGEADEVVPDEAKVFWAVALHRALVDRIGYDAPPTLTGAYVAGVRPPANRVSLQVLTGVAARVAGRERGSMVALLIARDTDTRTEQRVADAFAGMRVLRRGKARPRVLGDLTGLDATTFWPPADGLRIWRTEPAAVPDTRPVDRHWDVTDAVCLSASFVWRDDLPDVRGRGGERYRALAQQVSERGLTVVEGRRLHVPDVSRYVHRVQEGRLVQPYRAVVRLGDMVGERALVALGQSRHLGGGLLVPTDLEDVR